MEEWLLRRSIIHLRINNIKKGEIKMKSPFDKIIQESETKLASEVINDIIDRTRYWERLYKSGKNL